MDFEITWRAEVFSGAPQAGSAAKFGTKGINFRARRVADAEEWRRALSALACAAHAGPAGRAAPNLGSRGIA